MDETNEKIIGILRENARESFSAIGRIVGLSTNAVANRVRRLERSGVIIGYRAMVAADVPDRAATIEAFIDVRLHTDTDSEQFLAWSQRQRQVRDAVHVTGPYDYLLHVNVRDTADLDRLLRRIKTDARASQTQTRLALRA